MDQFLAQYFGTNQEAPEQTTQESDLEKMAQLVMLDKLAADQNIDLSGLSDDEYIDLANQVFNDQGQEKTAQEEEAQEEQPELSDIEKVAQQRFEESKFLGQVIAHSLWNELASIQKQAAGAVPEDYGKDVAKKIKIEQYAKGLAAGAVPEDYGKDVAKKIKIEQYAKGLGEKLKERKTKDAPKGLMTKIKGLSGKALEGAKKHKGKAGLGAAGAALLTGGAIAASKMKGKEKEGSALDTLSDARAYEILQENGLADDQGNVVTPDQLQKYAEEQQAQEQAQEPVQEKTAAEQLAEEVEVRAWTKLAELGYPVGQQD